jgi:hypothetical protein
MVQVIEQKIENAFKLMRLSVSAKLKNSIIKLLELPGPTIIPFLSDNDLDTLGSSTSEFGRKIRVITARDLFWYLSKIHSLGGAN